MGGYDAPAFGHAHPGLALAADAFRGRAGGFGIGDGKIAAEGDDISVLQGADPGFDIAAPAECRQGFMADDGAVRAVTQGFFIVPEQLVDHIDIVGEQCFFVGPESLRHFGDDLGEIDFHFMSSWRLTSP